ncbi:hypothetical protein PV327_002017 [Microctonus hyperodae]|uniref:Uncharacterized protein n=1 Tax=Microctonus hyperodae TaxID=165561 RepID=A0AA39KNT8_MICHY|nr:hypothetical protein PV327_002017 [Microctonus hyperodae]
MVGCLAATNAFPVNPKLDESQGNDVISRDACYGCFFRASNKPSGYPMLISMSDCANLYLNDDNYGHCQIYLKNATTNAESGANPTRIYCTFLECIREVNKNALIRNCANETMKMFPNLTPVNNVPQFAQLFVNTTACILAKTRCSGLNPITGAYQESTSGNSLNKFTIPIMNAIFVNSNYDINIIHLPFGNGIIDECAKYRNIEQATWPSVQC